MHHVFNTSQKARPCDDEQKKKKKKDFAVPMDHRVKIKENENKDNNLDLARDLRNLYNMRVMVIQISICPLGKVPKGLVRILEVLEIRRRIETVQTTLLLRSV